MLPNLEMKTTQLGGDVRGRGVWFGVWRGGNLPIKAATLAWKQLGNCFDMLYAVQTLVQYQVTAHVFVKGGEAEDAQCTL